MSGPSFLVHLQVIKEVEAQTDRGAAIIGAAYLEERLLQAIKSRLYQPDVTATSLFGTNNPIGTFSAKIDLGYALALYGPKVYRDLNLVRKIRNDFAHTFDPISFSTEPIAQRCSELWLAQHLLVCPEKTGPTEPRDQYLRTVFIIFNLLPTEMKNYAPEWKGPQVMNW